MWGLLVAAALFGPNSYAIAVSNRVLVTGASGRLGSTVVSKLTERGIPVRALVRNAKASASLFGPSVEVFEGDVLDGAAMMRATQGCDAVVCVHGVKPPRLTRLSDALPDPADDPTHPYNVNYIGVKNIIAGMRASGGRKIVRVTGALIGLGEFNLFKALFNLLLSFSSKWHEASEIEIRKSGLDYTVVRPTGLKMGPPAKESNRTLILDKEYVVKKAGQISIFDVADLCVLAVSSPELRDCTTICTSEEGGSGPQEWTTLVGKMSKDQGELAPKAHWKGVALLLAFLGTVASVFVAIVVKVLGMVFVLFSYK